MKKRKVSEEISLVPYFDNFEYTLNWYKDFDVCKQVDNIDFVYDIERLKKCIIILMKMEICII